MDGTYDVVVVGGGAGGLAGAVTLARARRSVLVVDAGRPRNTPADGVHNFLGREGTPPAELLAAGRAELAGYGGELVTDRVVAVTGASGDFAVALDSGGTVRARRLLVATGLVDTLPEVPGLAGRWGRDVLHCPYCHGREVADRRIGVLATGPMAMHQVLLWRQWSTAMVLLAHTQPAPTGEPAEELAARGITVVTGTVTGLEVTGDALTGVRLDSGRTVPLDALVVATRADAHAGFLAPLGLAPTELEMGGHVVGTVIPADAHGATAVPGVWVAGNAAAWPATVISSAAAGVTAATQVNADLVTEDTRLAVRNHRESAPLPA